MNKREISERVTKSYFTQDYNKLVRWMSFWYQIDSILKIKNIEGKKILEIGVGNKFVSNYLKDLGLNIKTCDMNKNLKPDFVADIKKMPFKDNQFDVVVCFEVLEHMPFKEALEGLKEMRRVTSEYVIFSVPYSGFCISAYIKPFATDGGKIIRIPFPIYRPKILVKKLGIGHYWTVGELGTSKYRVRKKIKELGYIIIKEEIPVMNSHHQFWTLRKI
ncbi:class I SAM-dependent methyltransferase [Candidatus Woesearchaeota archaeon]|nr:class I SAM-dependent methyltransferase [Candidatus Woesearchaeota archaeon]